MNNDTFVEDVLAAWQRMLSIDQGIYLVHLDIVETSHNDDNLYDELIESISPAVEEEISCPICLESEVCFVFRQLPVPVQKTITTCLHGTTRRLLCGHVFHRICLDDWLRTKFNRHNSDFACPVCRKIVG